MIDQLLHVQKLNLKYLHNLVADLTDEQMAASPTSVVLNHPAWILGHLLSGAAFLTGLIGGKAPAVPENYEALFGMKSKPSRDRSIYPSKAELVKALDAQYAAAAAAVKAFPQARWSEPFPKEAYRGFWPTLGDCITYMLTAHDAGHLGQLSAWRRGMGLPSVQG